MSSSYPKILHIGDKQIADLFDGPVEITEKIDGSQFGFGKINGELICRSKGKEQDLDNPDKMFVEGVEYVKSISDRIPDNTFFYGEYLQKPRHSTLAYDRIPRNYIALFGVLRADRTLGDYSEIERWAEILELEAIPLIHQGVSNPEAVLELINQTSVLGGQKVEGVVVKRYEPWLFLGTILTPVKAGKYVSEEFKEVHRKDWKSLNTSKGALDVLADSVRTEARWNKAIHHLRDNGEFEGSVRDIGRLIKEIHRDLTDEERDSLKDQLWRIYGPTILKGSTQGFVDWYKQQIVKGEYQDV